MKTRELRKEYIFTNHEVAIKLKQLSDAYKYLGPSERFRAIAYENASKTISNLNEPLSSFINNYKKIDELKGIGKSITGKIIELFQTGKIKTYESLKEKIPVDLLSLMQIEGIGPATIRKIESSFHVKNRSQLKQMLLKNKYPLNGIGANKWQTIMSVLNLRESISKRFLIDEVKEPAEAIAMYLKAIHHVEKVMVAGSIRRAKDTIGDIDIVVCCRKAFQKDIADRIVLYPHLKLIIAKGNTKLSFRLRHPDIQCDIRLVEPNAYGAALLYFTGSKEHNIQLRSIAKSKGLKLNEYGLFDEKTNVQKAGKTETEIYKLLGFEFIPPQERLGTDELKRSTLGIE